MAHNWCRGRSRAPGLGADMKTVDWRPFDYDHKAATRPPDERHVWIFETYASHVTTGYFDGFTFRVWYGSDDCFVSHWAPIEYPAPPSEVVEQRLADDLDAAVDELFEDYGAI